ncbi:MAG TPA: hypothetical protein VHE30_25785 [Polyangiaceae bacterium]|nr:hypothetical protein [Polyangiaceae bacterium]
MPNETTFQSGEKDGLHELVLGAAARLAERDGAVGLIALSADASTDRGPELRVEAEFAYRDGKRVLGGLEVRTKLAAEAFARSGVTRSAWLRDTLPAFGGTRVVNLWLGKAGTELLDVTVSFGSKIPFLADNVVLEEDPPSEDEAKRRETVLRALGVRVHREGRALSVPRRELRAPETLASELDAYEAARDAGYEAALYSAAVPCTQALRFAESDTNGGAVDIVLSRGLTPSYTCTSADAKAMEKALSPLGVRFADRSWALEHSLGSDQPEREPKPRGLKWFQNPKRR